MIIPWIFPVAPILSAKTTDGGRVPSPHLSGQCFTDLRVPKSRRLKITRESAMHRGRVVPSAAG